MSADTCEARRDGKPICSRVATHECHDGGGGYLVLCERHACEECRRFKATQRQGTAQPTETTGKSE